MKTNFYQRLVLIIFSVLFVNFAILNVPFRVNQDELKYASLFSSLTDLVLSRYIIILIVISILGVVSFMLTRNLKNNLSNVASIIIIIGILLVAGIASSVKFISSKAATSSVADSTRSVYNDVESTSEQDKPAFNQQLYAKKLEVCNVENAIRQFKGYMQFNYPDWRLLDVPVGIQANDCQYEVRATFQNPHYTYSIEKQVIVAAISFSDDYEKYFFHKIRGVLY